MVLEQHEEPGQVNVFMANHLRITRIMQQLKPYGVYSSAEEKQIDLEEQQYLVVTEPGQPRIRTDEYQIQQNHARFGHQSESDDSDDGTVLARTITAPEGSITSKRTSDMSSFTELGTDNLSHKSTQYETASSITISSDSTIANDQPSTDSAESVVRTPFTEQETDCSEDEMITVDRLPRPKAGWNFSSFPSFGTLVPTAENSLIFPKPPNLGRLAWFIATRNIDHGYNSGVIDEEYCDRIGEIYSKRIASRNTTIQIRRLLARRMELYPTDKTWAQAIKSVWQLKFPDSTINPDPAYQRLRDPKLNSELPYDTFSDQDFYYIRSRELRDEVIYNRQQHAVVAGTPILSPQWDEQQQQRIQNQAHATKAQQEVKGFQTDEQSMSTYQEYNQYLNHFKSNGHAWPKPDGLASVIGAMKNISDSSAFEDQFFFTKQLRWINPNQVIIKTINIKNIQLEFQAAITDQRNALQTVETLRYYHPRWLQVPFEDKQGRRLFQLNAAEITNLHDHLTEFLSIQRMAKNFPKVASILTRQRGVQLSFAKE